MKINTFEDMYLAELQELASAERQLGDSLERMAEAVSHAEFIRKFRILPVDFTEDTGELTPTMKVKRKVVAEKFAHDIDAIYANG